jgi:hypothetical protein
MDDHALDQILSQDESIIPSSGFVGSVMGAVRHEASAPPPLPFPWKWAIPGIAAAVVALVAVVIQGAALLAGKGGSAPLPAKWNSTMATFLDGLRDARAGWILLALLLTWASVRFSMRHASRRA